MQDIAGLRVVADMSLDDQDFFAAKVGALFPGARTVDRRKSPSYGYRAVHEIVEIDGYPVEIQIRTLLQHHWAQAMESLADRYGRDIRYGATPQGHAEKVETLLSMSERIAGVEGLVNDLTALSANRRLPAESRPNDALQERVSRLVADLHATLARVLRGTEE